MKASKLLEQRQPRAALDVVEQGMRVYGRDYQILLLAGISAYQADETRIALDYLRDSQRLHEDLAVQRLIAKLEKEQSSDKSGEKLFGNRFLLRYEGGNLDADVARSMVVTLSRSSRGSHRSWVAGPTNASWPSYNRGPRIALPLARPNGAVVNSTARSGFRYRTANAGRATVKFSRTSLCMLAYRTGLLACVAARRNGPEAFR